MTDHPRPTNDGRNGADPDPISGLAEAACGEMIERWRGGDRVPAETFLGRWARSPTPSEAFELVYLEYLIRERSGESPLEELALRFPKLADRLRRQVAVHRAIDLAGPGFSVEETGPAAPKAEARVGDEARNWPAPAGYEVERLLGRGGMGVVYQARQARLNRVVALKMILGGAHASPGERARFLAEARAIARLQHPNIVQIYSIGDHGGQPFIEMEYVAGGSLADELVGTPRPVQNASSLLETIARAIHEAHRHGIIHRDLKPSNVLLKVDGTPKIADFGVAKLIDAEQTPTHQDSVLGSPRYMAPEQAAGRAAAVGPAADVYAMGAIYYELLTGHPPFVAPTPLATIELARHAEPVPPSRLRPGLAHDVETICLKCLSKEPSRRYASAEALADDLALWLRGEPIRARPIGPWGRAYRWSLRNRAVAGLLAALFLILAAGAAGMTILWARARTEAMTSRQLARTEERSRNEVEQLSAGLMLDRGLALAESGDVARGLQAMVEALRIDPTDGARFGRTIRANIASWSQLIPRPVASLPLDGATTAALIAPDGRTACTVVGETSLQFVDLATQRPIGRPIPRRHLPIERLRYSPDGSIVVGIDRGGIAQCWEAATAQPVGPPLDQAAYPSSCALHPGGRLLATTTDKDLRLWDIRSGRLVAGPTPCGERPQAIEFSPDGSVLVTADCDRQVRRWDGNTAAPLGDPIPLPHCGGAVAFRPDGGRFVVGFGPEVDARAGPHPGGGILTVDSATGRPIGPPMPHDSAVVRVAYRPDGRAILAGEISGTVRLWDGDGAPIGLPVPGDGEAASLAFSPDGLFALVGSSVGTVRLFDSFDGRPIGSNFKQPGPARVGFFADGRRFAMGWPGSIITRDLASLFAPSRSMHEGASLARFAPDGRTLLAAGPDGMARLWDVGDGRPLGAPMSHRSDITAAAFSPDGRWIATGSRDATVRLWDARGTPRHRPIPVQHWVSDLRFGPDGSRLLATCEGETAHLIDPVAGRTVGPVQRYERPLAPVARVRWPRFRPDGKVALTASNNNRVARIDAATGQPLGPSWAFPGNIEGLDYTADGGTLVVQAGGKVLLCDPDTGQARGAPLGQGISAFAIFPDGRSMATGSLDRTLQLWDVASGRPVGPPIGQADQAPRSILAGADGRTLLVDVHDGSTRLWDVETRKPLGPALDRNWTNYVSGLAWNGRSLALIDQEVRVWSGPRPEAGPLDAVRDRVDALTGLHRNDQGGISLAATPGNPATSDLDATLQPADWHERIGLQAAARGDRAAARRHFERAVAGRPDDWYDRALLAQALERSGRSAEAEAQAAAARALTTPRQAAEWDACRGFDAMGDGRWADADAAFTRALVGERSADPYLRDARGRTRVHLAAWEGAIADLRRGPWRSSSMVDDLFQVVYVAALGGDRVGYREICDHQRAIRLGPGAPPLRPLSAAFLVWSISIVPGGVDDPAALVPLAESAVRQLQGNERVFARLVLGLALYRAGRPAEAIEPCEAAVGSFMAEASIGARMIQALAHRQLGDLAVAARLRDDVARWDRADDPGASLLRLVLLGEYDAARLDAAFPASPFP